MFLTYNIVPWQEYAESLQTYSNSELVSQLNSAYSDVFPDYTDFSYGACTSVMSFLDVFPWKDVILSKARDDLSVNQYSTFIYGDITLTRPPEYNITLSVSSDNPIIETICYPFKLVFETVFHLVRSLPYGAVDQSVAPKIDTITTSMTLTTTLNQTRIVSEGHAVQEWETTRSITTSLKPLIACGAEALIHNFRDDYLNFSSFLRENSDEPIVTSYASFISNYSENSKAFGDPLVFADYLNRTFNLIFVLPSDKKYSVIDEMGYCYLQTMLKSNNGSENMVYTTGDGWMFHDLFGMGSGLDYLTFSTNENSQIQEFTITADIDNGPLLHPVFPTFVGSSESTRFGITISEN
ncbi:unnamed protein product [Ambrosiozyma monospora]|uniref:Unnamed protein product n=1 Tax=Ambrosiozyma monospora TaxID=43982 RepID=A0ACB5TJ44_AMBMO|nr:unnamed protein product [Ambrosiozyma monospora]